MLIVLEGPDCSGKTTLARSLVDDLNAEYMHHGPPERDPLEEWSHCLDHYEPGEQHVVVDRLHWGELVYAPIYRGASQLGFKGWRAINDYVAGLGGLHVLVTAKPELIEQRVAAWHEPSRWTEKIGEVTRCYEWVYRLAHDDGLPMVRLDTDYHWPGKASRDLIETFAGGLEAKVAA